MATQKRPDDTRAAASWPEVPSHEVRPRHVEAYDQLRSDAADGHPAVPVATAVASVVQASEVTPTAVGHVVPSSGAYPVLGANFGPSAPGPVRAQEAVNPMADANLKDATRRKMAEAHGEPVEPEAEEKREEPDRSWLNFPRSEAQRLAAERQRTERAQDRAASLVARRRDHEETASVRAARRGPSPHQSELFMQSQSYPVSTLPAREQEQLYGLHVETETDAKRKEDEAEVEGITKKSGGYQISEYKSEYDQSGGYQISEYRSIYD